MTGIVILLLIALCLLTMLVCYASLIVASDYDDMEERMKYDKTCGNCRYAKRDKDNPDCYCNNEDADDFGYRVDSLDGCEEWEMKM